VIVTVSPGVTPRTDCRSTPEVSTVSDRPSLVCILISDIAMESTTPSTDCVVGTLADGDGCVSAAGPVSG